MGNGIQEKKKVTISVEVGDIIDFKADVVALKFAQWLHGAERAVASRLGRSNDDMASLIPIFGYKLLDTDQKLAAEKVLFISVPILNNYDYVEIKRFAANALKILQKDLPDCRHIGMVVHSAGLEGAGLNEIDAFKWKLAGLYEALDSGQYPEALERISIVDLDEDRAARLSKVLNTYEHHPELVKRKPQQEGVTEPGPQSTPAPPPKPPIDAPTARPRAYVLIPSSPELEDFFEFGIRIPAEKAGYDCSRAELAGSHSHGIESPTAAGNQLETRQKMLDLMARVSDEELQVISFALGIEYTSLSGSGTQAKRVELIAHLERRGQFYRLLEWLNKYRPDIPSELFPHVTPTQQLMFEVVQAGIDNADVVVADLTENDPRILFAVGYAYGKGKETILIVRGEVKDLPIDISGQLRLPYIRIKDLNQSLKEPFAELARQRADG